MRLKRVVVVDGRVLCSLSLLLRSREAQEIFACRSSQRWMALNTYHPIPTIVSDQNSYLPVVTALCFDLVSDTLWAGTRLGRVVAYHGTQGIRGVSFPVGDGQPVVRIEAGDQHVRACGSAGVGSWNKGGVNKWYFR